MTFQGGWIASLSTGETVFQNDVDGELSSWQRLKERCENGVYITMLRLQHNGVTITGLPGADGYMQCYEWRRNMKTGKESLRQAIGSVIGEHVVMTWIDPSNNISQDIQEAKNYIAHTIKARS